jgi:hypothetical protein
MWIMFRNIKRILNKKKYRMTKILRKILNFVIENDK